MKRFYVHGYCICHDSDNYIYLKNEKDHNLYVYLYDSLFAFIENNYNNEPYGAYYTDGGFGEKFINLPKVNLRIYATDKESTIDEAMISVLDALEGSMECEASYYGYSEYTIEGLNIDKFCIGGHDLWKELKSYRGKYIHFVLDIVE